MTANPERAYAAVWHSNRGILSKDLHGLDPSAHLQECQQLAADGWRPAAISVASVGDGQPLVSASAWHRPVGKR